MDKLKEGCIIANMGHSVQEIDTGSLKDLKREKIRPHVTHIVWPDEKRIVLLAEVIIKGQLYYLYIALLTASIQLFCVNLSRLAYIPVVRQQYM